MGKAQTQSIHELTNIFQRYFDMNKQGVIYILVNPAFPQLVKIGYTDDISSRLRALNNNSNIPESYRVYSTYDVPARLEDTKLHSIIDTLDPHLRYNKKREFFEMSASKAYRLLECIAFINGLQDNLKLNPLDDSFIENLIMDSCEASKRKKKEYVNEKNNLNTSEMTTSYQTELVKRTPKPPLTFDMIGVCSGEELVYAGDESIKVMVDKDLRHVIYEGVSMSMSSLARKLLNSKYSVQGPLYFKYKGKLLTDIRIEMEANNSENLNGNACE